MPFSWSALPHGVNEALARAAGLPASEPASALADAYGEPPDEQVVRDLWVVMRDRWLGSRPAERATVVQALRSNGLGRSDLPASTKAEQMDYLRTCRNSRGLRAVVLSTLLESGEVDGEIGDETEEDDRSRLEFQKDPFGAVASLLSELNRDQAGYLEWHLLGLMTHVVVDAESAEPDAENFGQVVASAALAAIVSVGGVDDSFWGTEGAHRDRLVSGARTLRSSQAVARLYGAVLDVGQRAHADLAIDPGATLVNIVAAVIGLIATGVGPVEDELFESITETIWLLVDVLAEEGDGESGVLDVAQPSGVIAPDIDPDASISAQVLEALEEILGQPPHIDEDGDVPIPRGSALIWVRTIEPEDAVPQVLLMANLVSDVTPSPELFVSINSINERLRYGAVAFADGVVRLRSSLPAEVITANQIFALLEDALNAADYFDSAIAAKFGGTTWLSEQGEYVDV